MSCLSLLVLLKRLALASVNFYLSQPSVLSSYFYATLSHPHYHGFVIEVCGHVRMSHAENNLGTMEPYMARTANPPTQGSNSFGKRAVVPSRLLIVRFVSTEERICKSNF